MDIVNNRFIRPHSVRALFVFLWVGSALFSHSARGSEPITCSVLTVLASQGGTGIDSALTAYKDVLNKPPFAGFDSFSLVGRETYRLSVGEIGSLRLPNGLDGNLHFRQRMPESDKLKLKLMVKRPGKPEVIMDGEASKGVPFIAAGFKTGKGRWVFIVACQE